MVKEKDKVKVDKVCCCYFDEGNLQSVRPVDVKGLKITTGPLRLIHIYESRRLKV